MALEVQLDALAEHVGPEIALEHRHHLRALLIGDAVEAAGDLVVAFDRLADRPALAERVGVHRVEGVVELGRADAEVGPPRLAGLLAHPFGEALIEPDVGPPRGRDEIAEPLVRHLVRRDLAEAAELRERCVLVEQDQRILVDDQAGVLHRAALDRRGEEIELLEREGRAEIGFEQGQQLRPLGGGIGHARRLALGGDDAERQQRLAHGVRRHAGCDDVERPDADGDEIGRQRACRGEAVRRHRTRNGCAGLGRVGEGLRPRRYGDRQGERRLEAGLVEAREHPPRVDRLELRPRVPVVADLLAEQALGAVAEAGGIIEFEGRLARRQRRGEIEADDARRIDLGVGRRDRLSPCADRRLDRGELVAVDEHGRCRPRHGRVDLGMAGELGLGRIDGQVQAIGDRRDAGRQLAERRRRGRRDENQRRRRQPQMPHR